MACRYEKDELKEKKIEKISKIWIRKIFISIRPKSTPTTIRKEPSQEGHNRQPTHWVHPLGKHHRTPSSRGFIYYLSFTHLISSVLIPHPL